MAMIQTATPATQLPRTLEEFLVWEPTDGLKHEWNDGELITFIGMKQQQWYVYKVLQNLFIEKGYFKSGTLIAEPDVMLTGIQMRRPDIAYFTNEQIKRGRENQDAVPEFVIEVISTNDQIIPVRNKLREYFKNGVRVAWLVYPDAQEVEVFTSYKEVKICTGTDVCSAAPVLPEFEIRVAAIFAE
jgi:Uma2 family endonuclease